ncbi:MAG: hypothetical protein ORN21_02095, partial [Methylophilaceae bacterium]|nr:hypothetical protein [Methylophilaceae bacterium]
EQKRMDHISESLNLPTAWLRFNPDHHYIREGDVLTKVEGCWGPIGDDGRLDILDEKIEEWQDRLSQLVTKINEYIAGAPRTDKVYLFYNR